VESVGVGGDEVSEAPAFVVPGKVCGNGSYVAEPGQVILGLRARIGLAGADDDARACLQQTAGHHHADTACAAGDEGGFAGQVEKFRVRRGLAVRHWFAFHRRLECSCARVHHETGSQPKWEAGNHLAVLMPAELSATLRLGRASTPLRARRVTPRSGSGGFATVSSRPSR